MICREAGYTRRCGGSGYGITIGGVSALPLRGEARVLGDEKHAFGVACLRSFLGTLHDRRYAGAASVFPKAFLMAGVC